MRLYLAAALVLTACYSKPHNENVCYISGDSYGHTYVWYGKTGCADKDRLLGDVGGYNIKRDAEELAKMAGCDGLAPPPVCE